MRPRELVTRLQAQVDLVGLKRAAEFIGLNEETLSVWAFEHPLAGQLCTAKLRRESDRN